MGLIAPVSVAGVRDCDKCARDRSRALRRMLIASRNRSADTERILNLKNRTRCVEEVFGPGALGVSRLIRIAVDRFVMMEGSPLLRLAAIGRSRGCSLVYCLCKVMHLPVLVDCRDVFPKV